MAWPVRAGIHRFMLLNGGLVQAWASHFVTPITPH